MAKQETTETSAPRLFSLVKGHPHVEIALTMVDGGVDVAATMAAFEDRIRQVHEIIKTDSDSVSAELNSFLLSAPGLKNCSFEALVGALWDARNSAQQYADSTFEQKNEAREHLRTVLKTCIDSSPDQFFTGRKLGVLVRYVPGDYIKDEKDGTTVLTNAEGEPMQKYRYTNEEWNKATAKKTAA